MVSIARALTNYPTTVLADEPTGTLDEITGDEIVRLLSGLNVDQGTTVILVTHKSQMVLKTERILFLSDRKLLSKEKQGLLSIEQ